MGPNHDSDLKVSSLCQIWLTQSNSPSRDSDHHYRPGEINPKCDQKEQKCDQVEAPGGLAEEEAEALEAAESFMDALPPPPALLSEDSVSIHPIASEVACEDNTVNRFKI